MIMNYLGNKTLLRGGLFSIYSFINQGFSFLLLIVLANFILPGDYGRLSLFSTVLTLIGYFMAFSSNGYFSISYFQNNFDDFRRDFSSIIVLALFSLFFFFFICGIIIFFFKIDVGFSSYLLWYVVAISFCQCIFALYLDYYRVKEKVVNYGIVSCSNALLNFVLSLFFVIQLNQNWLGRIEAQTLCSLLFGIIAFMFFKKRDLLRFDIKWERIKKILYWGVPLIPHHASVWIKQGVDRYIVNYYYSIYEVGLFSFALNLTSIIVMVGIAFNQTYSVSIFKYLSSDKIQRRVLFDMVKKATIVYFAISVIIVFFVNLLVPVFLPKYSGSLSYFAFLSVYGLFQCLYFLGANFLYYYGKTKTLMQITFFSSLFHMFLSLLFSKYSLLVLCLIYIVSQCVILYYLTNKVLRLIKEDVSL